MTDHGVKYPYFRLNIVPVVLSLANPPWQREVWLCPDEVESLDHVVHVLFDDFCDADDPQRYLGVCLRTQEEVDLMAKLGAAFSTVSGAIAGGATDEAFLEHEGWAEVVAAAGRLAQAMVRNDQRALAKLDDAGHRWPDG
ncbi:SCO4402 family protein [Actinokineospora globicatena]|uniref:Uncharacterized protein n=1 Tax=Actinokineospora globicatena TaxID=103729 RepID=A0A9W6V9R2_9PSEU|nr:hypothetical protein [Actinokineospora globicatena]GLW92224.1 hypothetical protein Aglo03_30400 [Actinokineospora globicatena]